VSALPDVVEKSFSLIQGAPHAMPNQVPQHWNSGLLIALVWSSVAIGQPLEIGHLETTDDSGISWQFWSCQQTGTTLHCQITQTMINHEVDPTQKDAVLKKRLTEARPESFRREMADTCKNVDAIQREVEKKLSGGKKPDGTTFTRQETADIRNGVATLNAACKNSTQENIRRMIEQELDQSARTCVVTNLHDTDTLRWNAVLKEWESRTPETGPCGSVVETRLRKDESSADFWLMDERHLFKRPNAKLPTGASCSVLPADKTYHFTWRASQNAVDCTYIKNAMN
jgi:hypothetical protein